MADQTAVDFAEFEKKHTEALKKHAIALADDDGQLGSGVLVNVNQRHFIATAAHCIVRTPKVIHLEFFTRKERNKVRIETERPIRILTSGFHSTLDIGYLEILEPPSVEITEAQLESPVIIGGTVHVIGFPDCMVERLESKKLIKLHKVPFATQIREIADDFLKLDYPVIGKRAQKGEWVDEPFPKTPHGFSGAGCFGVNQTINQRLRGLEIIEYKLLGIQCSWNEDERYVKVVPIHHWLDLVKPIL
jgi:hypothetical protein